MTQLSLFWNGASLGDADAYAPYELGNADVASPTMDIFFRAILNGTGNRGVLKGWTNELEPTGYYGSVNSGVEIDTGGAVVFGLLYENTDIVDVDVPWPTYSTRYDRIVIRRDWDAQTARLTRIPGVEGGGIPALTQSAAPDGTGIYDIPICYVDIRTDGILVCIDEREWITMSTAPRDEVFTTAHLTDESVDWTARETRSKVMFVGGGDWHEIAAAGRYSYTAGDFRTAGAAATWGAAAAASEGWQVTGAATYFGFQTSILPPPDWAGGDIEAYVWWMEDANVAWSANWYSFYQIWKPGEDAVYCGAQTTTAISGTYAVNYLRRQTLATIDADLFDADSLIDYAVFWYNSVGAEALLFEGVEFVYTGYL